MIKIQSQIKMPIESKVSLPWPHATYLFLVWMNCVTPVWILQFWSLHHACTAPLKSLSSSRVAAMLISTPRTLLPLLRSWFSMLSPQSLAVWKCGMLNSIYYDLSFLDINKNVFKTFSTCCIYSQRCSLSKGHWHLLNSRHGRHRTHTTPFSP